MQFMKRYLFTLTGLSAAIIILGIERIGDFFLFAPRDKIYIDFLISALIVSEGILLDSSLRKLTKEKELKAELKQTNEGLDRKNKELQESLGRIKVLSGLLPICSSCKKIRDDRGYWHRVESYISEHSEAEFTHGICPECITKLYP